MELFDSSALVRCIKEAVRSELQVALKEKRLLNSEPLKEEKLLTKKEMAEELDISLVTLTDWMKKGLPYRSKHSRIYFIKEDVFNSLNKFPKK